MGFGGVGGSGMGSYHGREGFDTFTHKKALSTKDLARPAYALPAVQLIYGQDDTDVSEVKAAR